MKLKPILDACCGSRMFWFDARNPNVLFVDNRRLDTQAIWKSGNGKAVRYCTVDPDLVADFRHLPFPDKSFKLGTHADRMGCRNGWEAR